MTEIWDIQRYVEDHPEDSEQRWRLAKKLYMAWEYRLALEHLQVLKNEWTHRLNIRRYLAATYYRLGRYEEAAAELNGAIIDWPDEIGLREQLARVLEISGSREAAAEAWDSIREMDPNHPIAKSAVKRLKEKHEDTPVRELRIGDSDSGIDLSPGIICPNCGAQNSAEFDRCWQCHAQIDVSQADALSRPGKDEEAPQPIISLEIVMLAGGILVVALLTVGFYLGAKLLLADQEDVVLKSVWDIYQYELGGTRVAVGLLSLAFWPGALWLALITMKVADRVSPALVNLSALFLAAFTFVASWLPANVLFLALLVPVALSLVIVLGMFRLAPPTAIAVWGLQILFVAICLLITSLIAERVYTGRFYNPFTEIPAIMKYQRGQKALPNPGTVEMPVSALPVDARVRWMSTGSAWLDQRAGDTEFQVALANQTRPLMFELQAGGSTLLYEELTEKLVTLRHQMESGRSYEVSVDSVLGDAQGEISITITGMLRPEFES